MIKYKMIKCENLFRIKALRDVGEDVKKGDLGGLVENENNLSQDGGAWIYRHASAQGNSRVLGDARVTEFALVTGGAWVLDNAVISGKARVAGDAAVFGNASVSDSAWVSGEARVTGNAVVFGKARVAGDAWVYDDACVSGSAIVTEFARVFGNAYVHGCAEVKGNAHVHGCAHISEEIIVKKGEYKEDLTNNRNYLSLLRNEFSVSPVKDVFILYKKVNSTSDESVYTSCFDQDFIYEDGKTAVAEKIDVRMVSCASGLHVSTPEYWHVGDTLIAVEINVKDIITIQDGKIRVSKLKVINNQGVRNEQV